LKTLGAFHFFVSKSILKKSNVESQFDTSFPSNWDSTLHFAKKGNALKTLDF